MSKIEEIIRTVEVNPNELYLDSWTLDDVRRCMKEYAEWYGKECLKIASENAETCLDSAYNMMVDKNSILNISFPEHE